MPRLTGPTARSAPGLGALAAQEGQATSVTTYGSDSDGPVLESLLLTCPPSSSRGVARPLSWGQCERRLIRNACGIGGGHTVVLG